MKNSFFLFTIIITVILSCSKNNSEVSVPTVPSGNPVVSSPVTLIGFTPTSGPAGTLITINGTNFSSNASSNIVRINDFVIPILTATSTQLTITIPSGVGTGRISITLAGIQVFSTSVFSKVATTSTLAGQIYTFGFLNGPGASAKFKNPMGVAIDLSGNIFVADADNHCIRKIITDGTVSTFAGNGTAGSANGQGTAASFWSPYGLAFDSQGNLFVSEYYGNRIRKISPQGNVSTFAGSGVSGYVNGVGIAAQFYAPAGITIDGNDNIYVADNANNRIRKITSNGVVTNFAGNGGSSNSGGTMIYPRDVKVDVMGNLYVVGNPFSAPILKVTPSGQISDYTPLAIGYLDGDLSIAQFQDPRSLCFDNAGNLYVADNLGGRLRKISVNGQVSTIDISSISSPSLGMAIDANGNFIMSKSTGHCIIKISP